MADNSNLFSAFAPSDASSLAGSRLVQYMGASKSGRGPTPSFPSSSPFEAGINAPVFVPSTSRHTPNTDLTHAVQSLSLHQAKSVPNFTNRQSPGTASSKGPQDFTFTATSVNTNGHAYQPEETPYTEEDMNGAMMYYYEESGEFPSGSHGYEVGESEAVSVPTYTGPPAHLAHYRPRGAAQASFFASDEIKMTLMGRQHQRLEELNPDLGSLNIPTEVEGYSNLVPLETVSKSGPVLDRPGFFMTHPSTIYKAISAKDGLTYALRRVHNCRLLNTKCLGMVELWKKLQHSNVVGLRAVFSTKAFNDYSLVFVYDYHGGAETLKARHFSVLSTVNSMANASSIPTPETSPPNRPPPTHGGPGGRKPTGMEEPFVWMYVIQLSSALRSIHAAGLAATTIDPSKILIVGRSKLLINCCGIMDVLAFEHSQMNLPAAIQHFQQEDLISLGRLIVALCCGSLASAARENLPASIQYISQLYSNDMKNIVTFLLAPPQPGRAKNINEIMPMIGARFYTQLEASQARMDMLENELGKEIDNGRLFRLLCKLGTINERPEFNMDGSWSETGDRYLLKLYRDYLFHQVDADGRPWLDLAHVVHSLNKLDAGVSEKVVLSSRDEQNILLVSYADLRRCLEGAFKELADAALLQPAADPNGGLH